MKKAMIPTMALIICVFFAGYAQAGGANPAALYCIELGYQVETITEQDGGQFSVCVFPDGYYCDAWEFVKGTCGEEYSYCALNGYDQVIKTDGKNAVTGTYAVCVDGATEIGNPLDLMGITEKLSEPIPEGELPAVLPAPRDAEPVLGGMPQLPGGVPPAAFDYRNYNGGDWMTPVKDQSVCGSCWDFTAIGNLQFSSKSAESRHQSF